MAPCAYYCYNQYDYYYFKLNIRFQFSHCGYAAEAEPSPRTPSLLTNLLLAVVMTSLLTN